MSDHFTTLQSKGLRKSQSNTSNKLSHKNRTPMPKCHFNKVALELYWNRTSGWVFSYNLLFKEGTRVQQRLELCEKPNMQILGTIFKWNLDLLVIFSFTTVKKTGWSKEVINGELKSIFLPSFENYNCWASCAENFGSRLEWRFINIWSDKLTGKFEVLNLNIIYYKLDADEITDCSYLILFIIKRLS